MIDRAVLYSGMRDHFDLVQKTVRNMNHQSILNTSIDPSRCLLGSKGITGRESWIGWQISRSDRDTSRKEPNDAYRCPELSRDCLPYLPYACLTLEEELMIRVFSLKYRHERRWETQTETMLAGLKDVDQVLDT